MTGIHNAEAGTRTRIPASILAVAVALVALCALIAAPAARADSPLPTQLPTGTPLPEAGGVTPLGTPGVQHLHFRYGPIHVLPGQNLILVGPVTIEKPGYDGYVTGFTPNLVRADGTVPPIEQIHLHHAVWLNLSRQDPTAQGTPGERIAASGEEKTIFNMPPGYGYPVKGSDVWALNYMIHNETPNPDVVWITYDVAYVPKSDPAAAGIVPVRPIWMDVQNGSAYPVFDVHRGTGTSGAFTYPDQDPNAPRRNSWTVDQPGTLIWTAGHLHPGGLYDELKDTRNNQTKLLFHSAAEYFDPAGPVSWDFASTATPQDWRVNVNQGDRLSIHATYETQLASWYESMGIMIVWMAPPQGAPDPFGPNASLIQTTGTTTHGHLPEANNHGGKDTGLPDPATLPNGQTINNGVAIAGFQYLPGNEGLPSSLTDPPIVHRGPPAQQLHFGNFDAAAQIWHTITACADPCTASTGISYPLANGPTDFDSGQLGYGIPSLTPAAQRIDYYSSANLAPGTYTYFCRVHPFMRGAFRVVQ